MGSFARCLAFVREHEGLYANDPADPGGETYAGISRRAHPELWAKADAEGRKHFTDQEIHDLYLVEYWTPIYGESLPGATALAVFDWYVHSGGWAVRGLQQVVGAAVDGVVGPRTLRSVSDYVRVDRLPGEPHDPERDERLAWQVTRKRGLFAGRWMADGPPERRRFAPGFMVRFIDLVDRFDEYARLG